MVSLGGPWTFQHRIVTGMMVHIKGAMVRMPATQAMQTKPARIDFPEMENAISRYASQARISLLGPAGGKNEQTSVDMQAKPAYLRLARPRYASRFANL